MYTFSYHIQYVTLNSTLKLSYFLFRLIIICFTTTYKTIILNYNLLQLITNYNLIL